jgi:hypothetical protein
MPQQFDRRDSVWVVGSRALVLGLVCELVIVRSHSTTVHFQCYLEQGETDFGIVLFASDCVVFLLEDVLLGMPDERLA